MGKKREVGEEWNEKSIKKNIITLIINKNKVSYRGFYYSKGRNEHTGSQTGSFNLSGEKTIIPKSLEKYKTIEKSRYTGEKYVKIKLPENVYKKGKFIKLFITYTVHQYYGMERIVGTETIKVSLQSSFQK